MPDTLSPLEAAEIIEKRMKRYHPSDAITAASQFAIDALSQLAAGEYKQVVHGRWCKESDDLLDVGDAYFCSNCDRPQEKMSKFCPSCGALMGKDDSHAP